MSLDAMVWAVKDAPVANVEEHAILSVMADEADEAGCGSLLATGTIARRAKLSEKTVQRRIDDMIARKLIAPGDQSKAEYIRADRRPVVYDLLIPFSAYSPRAVARVNEARAGKSLAPITAENRPEIAAPPPVKRRADRGRPRDAATSTDAHGVTSSPPVPDGVTGSPPVADGVTDATGGLVNRHGGTSKSSDGGEYGEVNPDMPDPRGDYQTPDPIDPVLTLTLPPLSDQLTPAEPEAVREGEEDPEHEYDDQTRRILNAAVEATLARRQSWTRGEVIAAMREALDSGRHPADVADAILVVATDPSSKTPGRINAAGWRAEQAAAAAPPPAPEPKRVLNPGDPQCTKHRGEPRVGCGKCRADHLAADVDQAPGPALDGASARDLIRATTAATASAQRAAAARRDAARRPAVPVAAS